MAAKYGFTLKAGAFSDPSTTLIEHKDTPQGIAVGKSDVSAPFSLTALMTFINLGGVVIDEAKLRTNVNKEWAVRSRINGEDGQEGLAARIRRYSRELRTLGITNYADALESTANELDVQEQSLFESVVGIKEATGLQ